MEEKLGIIIKSVRLKKKMKLKEVAQKSGLSISFISQVERSKSSVTMTSLRKISEALDVNVSYFFQNNYTKSESIKRKQKNEKGNYNDMEFSFSNLTGDMIEPIFEPIIATLFPGEKQRTPYTHRGQEFLYILEGTLTVILKGEKHLLNSGDSVHIESSSPHTWFNDSERPVKLLIVTAFGDDLKK